MPDCPLPPAETRCLYIVAGYPTSGKTSALLKAARERISLFGDRDVSVIPEIERLHGLRERSDTEAKLEAGLWCTLADMPRLNQRTHLPQSLVLHLDLLLTYVRFRDPARPIDDLAEMQAAFARLLAQPALKRYGKYVATTLFAPLEEIQRRWRHRFPAGIPAKANLVLAEKDQLIKDGKLAPLVFAGVHSAWMQGLEALSRQGILAHHYQLNVQLRPATDDGRGKASR